MKQQINYEDEFERFKKSNLNSFNQEYLGKFEYSDVHHKYSILPKGYDYGENNLEELITPKGFPAFYELNFGWDMWVGCLLEDRL